MRRINKQYFLDGLGVSILFLIQNFGMVLIIQFLQQWKFIHIYKI